MEELGTNFEELVSYIVWPYLIIFILLSSVVKKNFGKLLGKITRFEWLPVYTVLIIATVVAVPYGLLVEDSNWVAIVVTYALGTSFYEIVYGWIESKIAGIGKK